MCLLIRFYGSWIYGAPYVLLSLLLVGSGYRSPLLSCYHMFSYLLVSVYMVFSFVKVALLRFVFLFFSNVTLT